jgi:hypothetical protein
MDGNGFDELTRRLATGRSRRSVLRGLIGGGAALVAARAGTSMTEAAGKVTICHWSPDLGAYQQISVSPSAVPVHQAHQNGKDIISPDFTSAQTCGDCNTACASADACTTAACVGGACSATSACTGYQTCGGGGVAGQCGCLPTFTVDNCDGVTCGEVPDGCGSTVICGCASGYVCGESGCEAIETSCSDVQLAGYPNNTEPYGVCVDDYLNIFVNGDYVTTAMGCAAPVSLGPLQTGDEISLELGDYYPPCTLEPIQLICGDTGAVLQELNPAGHCSGAICGNGSDDWGGYDICYSETFTVNF